MVMATTRKYAARRHAQLRAISSLRHGCTTARHLYFPDMAMSAHGNNPPIELVGRFAALADPVRLQILGCLVESEATASELATVLDVGMPSMSKHLNVLQRAGFVSRRVDAQRRHCALDANGFVELASWASQYEKVWNARLDGLAAVLDAGNDR